MNETIRFTIDEDLLEALGSVWPGEKSPLSLLHGTGKQITGDMIARLGKAGIIDASAKIKPEYQHAVSTLAQTRNFARLKFSAGERMLEFIVYFPLDSSGPVSLLHNGNSLTVEDPPGIDDAFTLVDLHTGHSVLSSTTFNGEFDRAEALALFALMDLERSTLLHGLADGTAPQNVAFDLPAIMDRVKNPGTGFQSLEFVLQSRIIPAGPPAPGQIEGGLASLAGRGMVLRQGSRYSLSEALYMISSRFLIMNSFAVVETGKLDMAGTMWGGSFLSLQAGVTDVLYLEGHEEEIIVRCITAAELLDLINRILSEPDTIAIPVQPPPETRSADATHRHCTQCGAEVPPGKKFCVKCGVKVS